MNDSDEEGRGVVGEQHLGWYVALDWRDGDIWTAIGDALISRSNSWKYRKQHGFFKPARHPCRLQQRTNNPIVQTGSERNPANKAETRLSLSRTVSANGIELFVLEQGQGPLVILCHGWPELSYSWRHQIPALAEAGFHVVAPDMRGFGRSSAPAEIDAYSIFDTVGDMVALVAALGEKEAVIVGHDWGAPVAWHAALFRPDIFTKVAGLSVPPPFRGRSRPLDALRAGGITNFYWQYFQPPGVAEAEFERDVSTTMKAVLAGRRVSDPAKGLFIEDGKGFLGDVDTGKPLPSWLSEADLAYFTSVYKTSGFRGGLNWYRNMDRNWELLACVADKKIAVPALFMVGERDVVFDFPGMRQTVAQLSERVPMLRETIVLPGCGHWTQQERAADVSAAMIRFLRDL